MATDGHDEETCLQRGEVIFEETRTRRRIRSVGCGRIGPATGPIGVMVSGWCPCVPLGRRQSPAQQQQQQQQQPPSSSRAPFTVSGATDRADMVQMFYYENRGKCCKKLLRYNGYPNKVLLFPEEGWARSASSSYWTLTPFWWSRSRCKVVEVASTFAFSVQGERTTGYLAQLVPYGSNKGEERDRNLNRLGFLFSS